MFLRGGTVLISRVTTVVLARLLVLVLFLSILDRTTKPLRLLHTLKDPHALSAGRKCAYFVRRNDHFTFALFRSNAVNQCYQDIRNCPFRSSQSKGFSASQLTISFSSQRSIHPKLLDGRDDFQLLKAGQVNQHIHG